MVTAFFDVPRRTVCMAAATAALCAGLLPTAHALPPQSNGQGRPMVDQCATEVVWKNKKAAMGAAAGPTAATIPACGVGNCDDPAVRDATDVSGTKTVRVIVHVMNSKDGAAPDGVGQAEVDAQMAYLNASYAGAQDTTAPAANVRFELVETRYHNDRRFSCIPAYSQFSSRWYNSIVQMKDQYYGLSAGGDKALNVFVSCQDAGAQGTLLGIGTFPWDPDALGPRGGIWMNSRFFGDGQDTLVHEAGHNLGLWHTHHGVSEISSCGDACLETPNASSPDTVGDLCSDTPATPVNWDCTDPANLVCSIANWGVTATDNYMGYGPDTCTDEFSSQQVQRAHCWTQDALAPMLDVSCVPSAEVCDGVDNDCNGQVDEGVSNSCGGCGSLANNPGDACGGCGTYVCDGADAVVCSDPGTNACGECGSEPTEICGNGIDDDCDGHDDSTDADCAAPSCADANQACAEDVDCCGSLRCSRGKPSTRVCY